MKRILSFVMIIVIVGSICGCELISAGACQVDFMVNGELYATTYTSLGSTLNLPTEPYMENMIFDGWYFDPLGTNEFNLTGPVLSSTTLYAKFVPDALTFTNMLTSTAVKSLVYITNKSFNAGFSGIVDSSSTESHGSGVVYQISDGYCYVLTNAHVVEQDEDYKNQSLTVEDPWGNEYNASIYRNPSAADKAYSEDYDLAMIYFKYTTGTESTSLSPITLASRAAQVGDYVGALGAPWGQRNAISCGMVLQYGKINVEGKDIEFSSITHTAPIDHGSSGGLLVNTAGELVGINFAGESEYTSLGYAIPLGVILDFMNEYVYLK